MYNVLQLSNNLLSLTLINAVNILQERYSQKNMMGGGPKVELNPKPKKILILGQFGTLKKYIVTYKTWHPKKYSVFPFQTQTYLREL